MSLTSLVADDNWQGFDDAWRALVEAKGPIDDLLEALEGVARKRRMPRCLPLLREHCAALAEDGRHEDAARLLGSALRGGGSPGELADPLLEAAEAAWGQEEWWQPYCELAGFQRGAADLRTAWAHFDDLRAYRPGLIVFHAAGWGTGEVSDLRPGDHEVRVRFQSGREDHFPLRTAVEIFEILPEEDLRAQSFRDPKALRRRLKEEPLDVLRSVLQRYDGKANLVTLRNALMQVGITGNAWTSWWRKTRLLAENSEWFRVTGNASRAEIEQLARAIDPVEGLKRQLHHSTGLSDAYRRVRDVLTGGQVEEALKETALTTLENLLGTEDASLQEKVGVWMLLREQRGQTPEEFLGVLRQAATQTAPADRSKAPALWEVFALVSGVREQERCAELLREVHGEETWLDEAARHLPHAPPGMVKPLLDALVAAQRMDDVVQHYRVLLARPTRAPFVLIALSRTVEDAGAPGELPRPVQRAQALLELAIYLEDNRRGNPLIGRAAGKVVDLLTSGETPILRRLLAEADARTLRNLRLMGQRGIDDAIDNLITDIALERGPDALASPKNFWDDEERIWTTRRGVDRRRAELTHLREVKIPENRDAIERAASYGDLSENAEWEQAIREQGELTSKAAQIERELGRVELLENAPVADGVVCPGTMVRYRDAGSGEEHRIVLLGPWDTDRPGAVFYRAPLPAGMLGKRPGQKASIELPQGRAEVEILDVAPAQLD